MKKLIRRKQERRKLSKKQIQDEIKRGSNRRGGRR